MAVPSKLCHRGNHTICHDETCACPECHFRCEHCGKHCKVLHQGVCAPCYRAAVRARPKPVTVCDDCGKPGAFRNPHQRKNIYRCTECWARTGEPVKLAGGTQGLVVACAHKKLTDSAHEFLRVRGNRYRCQHCHQDCFTGKGGYREVDLNIIGAARSG